MFEPVRARFGVVMVATLLVRPVALPADDRVVSVVVTGETPAKPTAGAPIPLVVHVRNGLPREITFKTFTTTPSPANLELQSLSVIDVRRDGGDRDLLLAEPEIDENALRLASPGLVTIPPGESRHVRTDLAKWRIRGGWQPGRYEVVVRVHDIRVDRFTSVTTDSATIRFALGPTK